MNHKSPAARILGILAFILILSIIASFMSCSESGQRSRQRALPPPSWDMVDSQGGETYDSITYNQVQDYLNLSFTLYSPDNLTSMRLDSYSRYEIVNVDAVHSGIVSFDQAFKLFYELYCPEYTMDYHMLKRQALMIGYVPMQLPVD